ncbi:MAG: MFS transporter, partial [Rhodanobacteraceae bacterium]
LEGALFFVPAVLVGAQHLSYAVAGLIAAIGALAFVVVIPGAGRALDRIGSRDVLLVGAFCTEAGIAFFALGFDTLWMSILAMLVAGFGFGALLGAPTRYIVTNEASPHMRSTAVGLLSQFLIVGQLLGASLAGGTMGLALTDRAGYRDTYLAFAVVALVACAIAATLRSRREELRVRIPE